MTSYFPLRNPTPQRQFCIYIKRSWKLESFEERSYWIFLRFSVVQPSLLSASCRSSLPLGFISGRYCSAYYGSTVIYGSLATQLAIGCTNQSLYPRNPHLRRKTLQSLFLRSIITSRNWGSPCKVFWLANPTSFCWLQLQTNITNSQVSWRLWRPQTSEFLMFLLRISGFKSAKLFQRSRLPSSSWQTTTSRGQKPFFLGFWRLSRIQRLVVLDLINVLSESD